MQRKVSTIQRANIKRFFERWRADPDFEKKLFKDQENILRKYNINLSEKILNSLWDNKHINSFKDCVDKRNHMMCQKIFRYLSTSKKGKSSVRLNSPFSKWKQRQENRARFQFFSDDVTFTSLNVELSKGCSGQCWFCSFAAPHYQGYVQYKKEDWQEFLLKCRFLLGSEIARQPFYFRSTDPFDNPEYENFLDDHYELYGNYPTTSTSMATKQIDRTRNFLKKYKNINFSILTREDLDRLHKEFTPEELKDVILILQFNNTCAYKAHVGRARRKSIEGEIGSYIIGFSVSLFDKTLILSVPATVSDDHPLGSIILDEKKFTTNNDFYEKATDIIKNNIIDKLEKNDIIRIFPELNIVMLKNGFSIESSISASTFIGNGFLRNLGEKIKEGNHTIEEIVLYLKNRFSVPIKVTINYLNYLFNNGFLDEKTIISRRKFI